MKLSAKLLDLAKTLLRFPDSVPSSEAAHAALLFVHVAWNKSLGNLDALTQYRTSFSEFEDSNPALWNEFKDTDHDSIIQSLVLLKQQRYPQDKRVIVVCGMRPGRIHVEWQ